MKAATKARASSVLWRALRTFGAALVAFLLLHVTDIWTVAVWKGAATSAFIALLTMVLRVLDFTDLPTPPAG